MQLLKHAAAIAPELTGAVVDLFELVASSPSPDTENVQESVSGFDSGQLLQAGIIFGAGILIAVAAKMLVHRIVATHNEIIARLAGRSVAGLVVTVALIYALSQMGIRVGLLLGALGVGGFALAFALQDILSNLIAGIILQIRQPFTYEDYVSIEDYEGTVTDITLRAVEMKLFSGEVVIIPSSTVLQNPIENWTRLPNRRIDIEIGVGYDTDIEQATSVLLDAVTGIDGAVDDPPPAVIFGGFGGSSVDFEVRLWFPSDGDYFGTRLRAATAIKRALEDEGIDIPFPITTVLGPTGGGLVIDRSDNDVEDESPAAETTDGRERQDDERVTVGARGAGDGDLDGDGGAHQGAHDGE